MFINTLWFDLDVDYYSSNVNMHHLNHSKCIADIIHLSGMNQTTNYGMHPCYVLDVTNHPTSGPTSNPTHYPTNNPTFYPSFHPTNNPSYPPAPYPTIIDLLTTSIPTYLSTHPVSIPKGRGFIFDNTSTIVIISILSLVLVVCIVGVILLFCICKKKEDQGTRGMDVFDDGPNGNVHHHPSAPVLQEEDANVYCILCCERKANMFNDPCGHVTYCNKCSSVNSDNKCPSCRQAITEFKQLYNAGFAQ
eukprot:300957_1